EAVNNGTAGGDERVSHLLVDRLHLVILIKNARPAPVVFQVINAPCGVGAGILLFVAIAAFVSGAGVGAGRGIDSQFETLAVHIIGQRLHVGKFLVGLDVALRVAHALPGVVNVDVHVAGVFHAALDHGIGHAAHGGIVNRVSELVPTVPAHGRG